VRNRAKMRVRTRARIWKRNKTINYIVSLKRDGMGIRRRIWREMDESSSEGGVNVENTEEQHEVKN
jgi:hypothetical protein